MSFSMNSFGPSNYDQLQPEKLPKVYSGDQHISQTHINVIVVFTKKINEKSSVWILTISLSIGLGKKVLPETLQIARMSAE